MKYLIDDFTQSLTMRKGNVSVLLSSCVKAPKSYVITHLYAYAYGAYRCAVSLCQDRLNKLLFPHPMETPYEICLQSA